MSAQDRHVYLYHQKPSGEPDRDDFFRAGYELLAALDRDFQPPVVLKPNIVWKTRAEQGIVTHPAFVRGLVEALLEKGLTADEIIVAEGGGVEDDHDLAAFYAYAGYAAELEPLRIELRDLNNDHYLLRPLPKGCVLKRVFLAQTVVQAGTLINVAKMKTHNMAVVTLCTKNLQGMMTPIRHRHLCTLYPRSDHDDGIGLDYKIVDKLPRFFQKQVDLYTAIRPHLNVIEGVVGRDGTGFNRGDNIPMGMALAGEDALVVDHVGAELMGFPAAEVGALACAAERELYDLNAAPTVMRLDEGTWQPYPEWRHLRVDPPFRLLRREELVYDDE